MTAHELQERLIQFAVAIIKFARKMPNTIDSKHLTGQLIRSGTHAGIHYGEVMGASSSRDWVHKIKVINKELRESLNTLQIIKIMGDYIEEQELLPLMKECNELIAIFTSSIKTHEQKNKNK